MQTAAKHEFQDAALAVADDKESRTVAPTNSGAPEVEKQFWEAVLKCFKIEKAALLSKGISERKEMQRKFKTIMLNYREASKSLSNALVRQKKMGIKEVKDRK